MSKHIPKIVLIFFLFVLLITLSAMLAGCNPQARGFALPEGDAETGRDTFVHLQCQHCHSVKNDLDKLADGHPEIGFELGGTVTRVKTYGDLVTSIINPSHKISRGLRPEHVTEFGDSRMRTYNQVMTVQELVDITAYLQTTYEVVTPQYSYYYHGP